MRELIQITQDYLNRRREISKQIRSHQVREELLIQEKEKLSASLSNLINEQH